jgi:predicted MFS family arabinose efflux permease
LLAVGAVGGIVGGLTASRVVGRLGDRWTLVLGLGAQVAAFAVLASTRSAIAAGAALALAILGTAWSSVVVISARQRLTPPALLGRVTAAFRTIGTGAMPLGAALGGMIAASYGLRTPQWVAAVTLGLVVVAAAVMSYKSNYGEDPVGVSLTPDHG